MVYWSHYMYYALFANITWLWMRNVGPGTVLNIFVLSVVQSLENKKNVF